MLDVRERGRENGDDAGLMQDSASKSEIVSSPTCEKPTCPVKENRNDVLQLRPTAMEGSPEDLKSYTGLISDGTKDYTFTVNLRRPELICPTRASERERE